MGEVEGLGSMRKYEMGEVGRWKHKGVGNGKGVVRSMRE